MTRFPASGGGSGPPYTYVMDGYPGDAEEGESLYHITEDAAYVYTGNSWVEQTVTNHGQLAGVSEGDHRSDTRVSEIAQNSVSVPNQTQNVGGTRGWQTYLDVSGSLNDNETDTYSQTVNTVINGVDYETSGNLWDGSYVRLRDFDGNVFWSTGTGSGGDAKSGRTTFSMRYVTQIEIAFHTDFNTGTTYSGKFDLHEMGPATHQHNI